MMKCRIPSHSFITMHADIYHSTYLPLAYAHLATVLPAFAIGTYLMIRRKGMPLHRLCSARYTWC